MDLERLKARIAERKRMGLSPEQFDRELRLANRDAIRNCIETAIHHGDVDAALEQQRRDFERCAHLM